MKRIERFLALTIVSVFILSISSCREKTTGEKIEDGVEEVGDGIEDAVDDTGDAIKDAADDTEDAMEDAVDDN